MARPRHRHPRIDAFVFWSFVAFLLSSAAMMIAAILLT
jgi:hypothetical protein